MIETPFRSTKLAAIKRTPPTTQSMVLKLATVLAATLAVAEGAVVKKPSVLKLRGGVDAGQVATGALALSGVNAGS